MGKKRKTKSFESSFSKDKAFTPSVSDLKNKLTLLNNKQSRTPQKNNPINQDSLHHHKKHNVSHKIPFSKSSDTNSCAQIAEFDY